MGNAGNPIFTGSFFTEKSIRNGVDAVATTRSMPEKRTLAGFPCARLSKASSIGPVLLSNERCENTYNKKNEKQVDGEDK